MEEQSRTPQKEQSSQDSRFIGRTPLQGIIDASGVETGTPEYSRALTIIAIEMDGILDISSPDDLRFEVAETKANKIWDAISAPDEEDTESITDEEIQIAASQLPDALRPSSGGRKQDKNHPWVRAGSANLKRQQDKAPDTTLDESPVKQQGMDEFYTINDIVAAAGIKRKLAGRIQARNVLQEFGIVPVAEENESNERSQIERFRLDRKQYELLIQRLNPSIVFIDPKND